MHLARSPGEGREQNQIVETDKGVQHMCYIISWGLRDHHRLSSHLIIIRRTVTLACSYLHRCPSRFAISLFFINLCCEERTREKCLLSSTWTTMIPRDYTSPVYSFLIGIKVAKHWLAKGRRTRKTNWQAKEESSKRSLCAVYVSHSLFGTQVDPMGCLWVIQTEAKGEYEAESPRANSTHVRERTEKKSLSRETIEIETSSRSPPFPSIRNLILSQ